MKRQTNIVAAIGLFIGAFFGFSGMLFTQPDVQVGLFVVSGIGLTTGLAMLATKFLREGQDLIATGFLLFAIGEAIITAGTAADVQTGEATFGAVILPDKFEWPLRIIYHSIINFPPSTRNGITRTYDGFFVEPHQYVIGWRLRQSHCLPSRIGARSFQTEYLLWPA